MKQNLSIITLLALLSVSYAHAFSFKSLYSYFSAEKHAAVEQQEIPLSGQANLIIENIRGPIHIQTWQQQKILLKATKRASKQEMLPQMSIDLKSNNNAIIIKTVYDQDPIKGSIEYDLLVPDTINATVKAQSSPIKVEHIAGMVTIQNEEGDIELNAIQGPITVEVMNKGSIVIDQPGNTIKAITHYGTIDIHDAKKSIFASTDNGKIKTSCKTVPHGSVIKLDASKPITLQLPSGIDADLQAESDQGSILCEHYVTIKPFITQLNAQAWNQFKRTINGSLGNGGAQICLHSVAGTIKITQETT